MTRITHLTHRALLGLSGPDWAPFLKGLCTAPVDALIRDDGQNTPIKSVYGAFLRPQGKMYADVRLIPQSADEVWLDVPANARDELLSRLTMYRLRAKVTIAALDHPVYVAYDGPAPEGFMADPRGDIVGAPLAFATSDHPVTDTLDTWTAWRMHHGLSDPGYDFAADALYAIDANLDLLDGIDFHKGCYVGQELTSRMKRRGQIKNRILPLRHTGVLTKGAEVLHGDRKVGEVLSSAEGVSLALIRLDRLANDLTCDGTPVETVIPAWIAPHLTHNETAA